MTAVNGLDQAEATDIKETILDAIGDTPLVRLHKVARGVRPALLATLLLATVCSATSTMVRIYLLFDALNLAVPILAIISSTALISILQALPISFSGLGVRDAILIGVLGSYGYGRDLALSLSALFLLLNIEHIIVGFLISLRHPLGQTPPAEPAQAIQETELATDR